jgi:hypothetical protein
MALVHVLKRVIAACSLTLLVAGTTAVTAQAATSSASGGEASTASLTSTLQPAAMPGCNEFNDGERIEYQGKYWECGYVMGIGWFWWEIPPPCGTSLPQYAREVPAGSC